MSILVSNGLVQEAWVLEYPLIRLRSGLGGSQPVSIAVELTHSTSSIGDPGA